MTNKQTSIEWLINQITEDQMVKAKSIHQWKQVFKQAKAMHKDEIKDAYWNGSDNDKTKNEILLEAEEFYNETYKETNLGKE